MRTTTYARRALAATALLATSALAENPRSYQLTRFSEDWTFLEDGAVADADPFDVVKNGNLGGPWRLTFGGSTRLRWEMDDNGRIGTDPVEDDDFGRLRQSLHLGIMRGGMFRWYTEVSHADTFGAERWMSGRDENDADVQNLFFDFTAVPTTPHSVTFRIGRQELSFGNERLVGVDDFANVRNTFDGLRIIGRTKRTETSLFCARPVERFEEHDLDAGSDELTFGGVYSTFRPRQNHIIEGYWLVNHDDSDTHPSEKTGDLGESTTHTVGVHYEYTRGGWAVETELAYQGGSYSDDDVRAGFGTVNGSYQWRHASWCPKLRFGVEVATGDGDDYDGDRNGFDPLYDSTRTGLGHVGVTGRRNIECARIEVLTQPMRGMRWDSAVLVSQLEEDRDALYDQLGNVLYKDPTGTTGGSIGLEAHSQVSYAFYGHHEVSLEVGHFWGDDVVDTTALDSEATWGFVGYEFKF